MKPTTKFFASCTLAVMAILATQTVWADSPDRIAQELVNCQQYKTKREAVPVYAEASASSRVLNKLTRGEFVCYVGEQCLSCPGGPYALVDWRRHESFNRYLRKQSGLPAEKQGSPNATGGGSPEDQGPSASDAEPDDGEPQGEQPEMAYVRMVDIFRVSEQRTSEPERGIFSQADEVFKGVGKGVTPEDIYGPFRPFIDTFHPPTACRAGKICSRVEELQRQFEQSEQSAQPSPEASGEPAK